MHRRLNGLLVTLPLTIDVISQLTGEISNLKIGVLKEGFGVPGSEADVDELVRKAAERLGREAGATVEKVSVRMHLDGK